MGSNEGNMDRAFRIIVGLALFAIVWFYWGSLGAIVNSVIIIVAMILVATAVAGWCPIYALFGISSCKIKD